MKRSKKTITSAALLASPRALEMAVAFLNEVVGQTPEKPDYWCACGQCDRNIDKADDIIDEVLVQNDKLSGGEAVRSDDLFGLRVVGHEAPLPHFFATEAEAMELRMRHRDHSPACLEVVRIAVKPNTSISEISKEGR